MAPTHSQAANVRGLRKNMTSLLALPVQHVYTFSTVAIVSSALLAARGVIIEWPVVRLGQIKPNWLYSYQPLINNLFGSLAGWLAIYILSLRTQPDVLHLGWPDLWLGVVALLGISGKLPETVQGFIISIGKAVETLTNKLTG